MITASAFRMRRGVRGALVVLVLLSAPLASAAQPPNANGGQAGATQAAGSATTNGVELLKQFDEQQNERVKGASALTDQNKRVIMFSMSLPLFLLLLITGGLGIATGVYGKKLYIPHMIFAGLTVTLALAHAIAGIVWFFPF